MNDQPNNERRLRGLLRSARPEPALPPRFQEGVWRRVEQLEGGTDSPVTIGWPERLVMWLLRPHWAVIAALLLVLTGAVAGTVFGASNANDAAKARYVASVVPQQVR